MPRADAYVHARIDRETKDKASRVLNKMGLSLSEAIRLLMYRVADEQRIPFEIKTPSANTRKALAEIESGKTRRVNSVDEMILDLNAGD